MSFYFSVYFFSRDSQKKLHLKDVENKCVCTGTTVCSDIHSTRSYFIFCLWIVVFFYLSSGDWQPFPKLLSKTFVTFAVCCCNIEVCRSESSTLSRWKICSIFFQEFWSCVHRFLKRKRHLYLNFMQKRHVNGWHKEYISIFILFLRVWNHYYSEAKHQATKALHSALSFFVFLKNNCTICLVRGNNSFYYLL